MKTMMIALLALFTSSEIMATDMPGRRGEVPQTFERVTAVLCNPHNKAPCLPYVFLQNGAVHILLAKSFRVPAWRQLKELGQSYFFNGYDKVSPLCVVTGNIQGGQRFQNVEGQKEVLFANSIDCRQAR